MDFTIKGWTLEKSEVFFTSDDVSVSLCKFRARVCGFFHLVAFTFSRNETELLENEVLLAFR